LTANSQFGKMTFGAMHVHQIGAKGFNNTRCASHHVTPDIGASPAPGKDVVSDAIRIKLNLFPTISDRKNGKVRCGRRLQNGSKQFGDPTNPNRRGMPQISKLRGEQDG
jgi:hypothetical protein